MDDLLAREAIRDLLARYNMAGDRLKEDEFIAVFTADAILESEGVPAQDAFRYNGRAEIQAWISRWRNPPAGAAPAHKATFVRHHLSTSQIDLTSATTARARTYWVAYTDIGPDHCGYYLDTFRKEGVHWLIAHRRVRLDWRSPQSLFTTAISNTNS
jgi:3-phenylpropionate/cinnamic acid dioxygenase small subunit